MSGPRELEKHVQARGIAFLRTLGAETYTIGRPPRRDAKHKGTGQTPGIPDVFAFVPVRPGAERFLPSLPSLAAWWPLWWEAKRPGGKLSADQERFRERCLQAGAAHVVGDFDALAAVLVQAGNVRAENLPHYRRDSIEGLDLSGAQYITRRRATK